MKEYTMEDLHVFHNWQENRWDAYFSKGGEYYTATGYTDRSAELWLKSKVRQAGWMERMGV